MPGEMGGQKIMHLPGYQDIERAHERIRPYIHRTPVMRSKGINEFFGGDFYFKCENLQKVGAFKFRGATNAVMALDEVQAKRGVVTHSSGNHAAALCLAARMRGIPAYIAMPRTAPEIKKEAVRGYGGNITFCEPTMESREQAMEQIVAGTGAVFIPPYNHFDIVCGQGTAAKELIEESGRMDIILAPVGGGGLVSGTATSAGAMIPGVRTIAVEPAGADDAYRSLQAGHIIPSVKPVTIADGLLTSLGDLTFAIIRERVHEIVRVSEEGIIRAMRMIWERMKIIVEPSGAVPFAAVVEDKIEYRGLRTGVILSGGNVDLGKLPFSEAADRR